ncbi:hypothetical protein K1719_042873 [Acacia pycnantha]|nr:hypothetical protein K1719_042873 [Acacia pycnantha]
MKEVVRLRQRRWNPSAWFIDQRKGAQSQGRCQKRNENAQRKRKQTKRENKKKASMSSRLAKKLSEQNPKAWTLLHFQTRGFLFPQEACEIRVIPCQPVYDRVVQRMDLRVWVLCACTWVVVGRRRGSMNLLGLYCSWACQALDWKFRYKAEYLPLERWANDEEGEDAADEQVAGGVNEDDLVAIDS